MTSARAEEFDDRPPLAELEWPIFGWCDDIRPALHAAIGAGRDVALATLFRVDGSAPRGPGAQMIFDGRGAAGYFSGDCIESDIARHAACVIADGRPRRLVYGAGSPWIDIRLRCGGSLHILVERVTSGCAAAQRLLDRFHARIPALWSSDGIDREILEAGDAPLLTCMSDPFRMRRRFDPPRRLIVSGGDPTALALAALGAQSQFETILVRAHGPEAPPPIANIAYLRADPLAALETLGVDAWTSFVAATHDGTLDIPACAWALARGAPYVGLVGAASRVSERRAAIRAAGAPAEALPRLHAPAGMARLGKAPWQVAVAVIAEVMQVTNAELPKVSDSMKAKAVPA